MQETLRLKYAPKIFTAISFLILLIFGVILFFGRTKPFLRISYILNLLPDFYQHVSNFSITWLLYAGIGYMWLLQGVVFRYIIGLGILFLAINFVCEKWISVLNTPDMIDAYYGFAGTISGFIFLLLTKQFGLKLNETKSGNEKLND